MIFSVVIPVYNVKDYLPKCIDSVLAQDFEDYEVILIDDGSTDGESGAICDRYAAAHPERIRAIHKPNGGVGEARNVGIEASLLERERRQDRRVELARHEGRGAHLLLRLANFEGTRGPLSAFSLGQWPTGCRT